MFDKESTGENGLCYIRGMVILGKRPFFRGEVKLDADGLQQAEGVLNNEDLPEKAHRVLQAYFRTVRGSHPADALDSFLKIIRDAKAGAYNQGQCDGPDTDNPYR